MVDKTCYHGLKSDQGVFNDNPLDGGLLADDAVAHDGSVNPRTCSDRHMRTDDRIGHLRRRVDMNRWNNNDAIWHVQRLTSGQQGLVCCQQGFLCSAIEPVLDGKCTQLGAAVDHSLQGIRQLEFTSSTLSIFHQPVEAFEQQTGSANVVDTDDGQIGNEFCRLFDQSLYDPRLLNDHSESCWVVNLVHTESTVTLSQDARQISAKDRISVDDQHRIIFDDRPG